MIEVKLQPSARLSRNIEDPLFNVTEEHRPPEKVFLADYPKQGDDIFEEVSGRSWVVVRVNWGINQELPIIEVE